MKKEDLKDTLRRAAIEEPFSKCNWRYVACSGVQSRCSLCLVVGIEHSGRSGLQFLSRRADYEAITEALTAPNDVDSIQVNIQGQDDELVFHQNS